MNNLEAKIAELHAARQRVLEAMTEAETLNWRLEATPQFLAYKEAASAVQVNAGIAATLLTQVRELALQAHAQTGSKTPAAGVQIKMVKQCIYDEPRVIEWATMQAPVLVTSRPVLNKRAFEDMLLTWKPGDRQLPGEVIQEPKAYVAADLTGAVGIAPAEVLEGERR